MKATDASRDHLSKWLVGIPMLLTVAFAVSAARLLVAFVPHAASLPPELQGRTLQFLVTSSALILSLWAWVLVLVYRRPKRSALRLSEIQKQKRGS
jgi:hypothetical protein